MLGCYSTAIRHGTRLVLVGVPRAAGKADYFPPLDDAIAARKPAEVPVDEPPRLARPEKAEPRAIADRVSIVLLERHPSIHQSRQGGHQRRKNRGTVVRFAAARMVEAAPGRLPPFPVNPALFARESRQDRLVECVG